MPQETKAKFETSGASAATNGSLQGWNVDVSDPATTMDVLEKAFDFRGDVTITRAGGQVITGYIFDRRRGTGLADSSVRLMTATSDDKITITFADVRRVEFGKDAAHGKSFETWVKKYVEKKLAGEKASIESESLD